MKFNNFLMAGLCLFIFSCKKGEEARPIPTEEELSTFVSMDQAEAEVLKLLSIIDADTRGTAECRRIVEKYSLGGEATRTETDEDPLVYVFNFNDGQGYAIASGDKRMPPVLCITDDGNLSDTSSFNEGVIAMLSTIDADYRMAVGLPARDADGNTAVTRRPDPVSMDDDGGGSGESTYTVYTSWTDGTPIGTRTQTFWAQQAPFNKYCKTNDGKEALVGCVAVAVGQMMYYWKKNATYNGHVYDWDIMKRVSNPNVPESYTDAWEGVQLLLRDLGRPENLNMTYREPGGDRGSSASCDNINRTFLHFGYSNGGTEQDYDVNILKNCLLDGPVIGCGYALKEVKKFLGITISTSYSGGHDWIYDQYMEQYRYRKIYDSATGELLKSIKETRTLVRCNWGWGFGHNGFYLSGSYDTKDNNGLITRSSEHKGYYQYLLKMHTGIRP